MLYKDANAAKPEMNQGYTMIRSTALCETIYTVP